MTPRKKTPEAPDDPGAATFETSLTRLEELVSRLEDGEVPLEESVQAYVEGMQLVRRCMEKLDAAEAAVRELSEDAPWNELASGDDDEDDAEYDDEV